MGRLKKLLFIVMAVAMMAGVTEAYAGEKLPNKEIKLLDETILNAQVYTNVKQHRIDSLTRVLSRMPASDVVGRFASTVKVSDQYRAFNADSALFYAYHAVTLLNNPRIASRPDFAAFDVKAKIALLNAHSSAGLFSTADEIFHTLESMTLTPAQKIEFWKAARQYYSYMKAYVDDDSPIYGDYTRQYVAYDDSLLMVLPHSDRFYQFIHAERLVRDGKYDDAERRLLGMVKIIPETSNLYAMAAYQLAEVYRRKGNNYLYATYLAKASIADIKGGVREGLALPTLAQWLYTQGNTNEAFRFINFAMSEANAGNARMRSVAIASLMPVIDSAYRERISKANDMLFYSVIVIAVLLFLSLFLLVMLYRNIKRTHAINSRICETVRAVESYFGHFIALCANYADKLDSLTGLVSRKIASGQSDELLKMVKSGRFKETQNDEFYAIFDTAFLEIYPDFIREINGLLQEDKQFSDVPKDSLTPELRIYALVRLGIGESTRISQVLHYSVSTIYTYRNRMRNRAVSRDTFEEDVKKICAQDVSDAAILKGFIRQKGDK